MAYDRRRLSLYASTLGGGPARLWAYETTDGYATVVASGYFTDLDKNGVEAGDGLIISHAGGVAMVRFLSVTAGVGVIGDERGAPLLFSDWGAARDDSADVTDALVSAITKSATDKRQVVIASGTYRIDKEHIALTGLSGFRVYCEEGVVFNDVGRILRKANDAGDYRLPWGIEFINCTDIEWEGGIFRSDGSDLGGSSAGTFDENNYTIRKPVLGFVGCERVRLRRIGHQGSAGQSISGADRTSIVSALGLTPTANEYAYFALRGAFFNAYQCTDFVREDCYLVPDTCSREQVTFCDSEVVGWHNERSVSTGNNFASLGKVIGCRKVRLGGHYVVDTGSGSLVDLIGRDIHFYGANLDYVNGKAFDVSQEWGPANQPSSNIRCSNIVSTGRGATCVGGTTEEMEAGPITDYTVENCRFNVGATDFSVDLAPIYQGATDITSINDVFINEAPFGRSWNVDGGTGTVKLINPKLTWTKPSGSLALARRQSISRDVIDYYDVDWLQNASLAGASNGLASFTFGKDADATTARHVFHGGRIRDASFAIASGVTVEFRGVDLTSAAFTFADDTTGKVALVNCLRDGVPTGNWSAEATTAANKFGTPAIRKEMDEFNAYICALKEIGAWDLVDSAGVLVTGKSDQWAVNIKTPYLYRPAGSGSLVWARLGGVAGDGASAYIDLNFGPTTAGINYAQDSAYIAIWMGGANDTSSASVLSQTVAGGVLLNPRTASDEVNLRVNDTGTGTPASLDSRGHFSGWRTGAKVRNWGINGVAGAGDSETSAVPSAGDFTIFRRSSTYSARTAYLWMIGGGGLGALNADIYYAKRYFLLARGAI